MLTALAGCDIDALVFIAEMYGVQLDQLAAVLGVSVERARGVVVRSACAITFRTANCTGQPGRPCPGPVNAGPSRPNSPTRRSPPPPCPR